MGRKSALAALAARRLGTGTVSIVKAMASWTATPSNRARLLQMMARSLGRRPDFRWWHGVFFVYLALLWRSTRKQAIIKGTGYWRALYQKGSTWRTVVAAHMVMGQYIFTKASVGALLLQSVTYNAALAPRYAAAFMNKQSAALQARLQNRVENFLDTQMDTVAEKTKDLLKDPYMPISIQCTIEDFVDVLLPDLKLALFDKTHEIIVGYRAEERRITRRNSRKRRRHSNPSSNKIAQPNTQDAASSNGLPKEEMTKEQRDEEEMDSVLAALEDDDDEDDQFDSSDESSDEEAGRFAVQTGFRGLNLSTPSRKSGRKRLVFASADLDGEEGMPWSWNLKEYLPSREQITVTASKSRAWILYTLSPYDRSFWRSIRNPWYLLLQCIGLVPVVGMFWWLFVFVLHDKRDEYQLSQFIVGFQSAKFFSQGCFNLVRGAFLYYLCATRTVPTCNEHGPTVRDHLAALSFFVQIVIVWLAFFLLPFSEPCKAVNDPRHAYLLDERRNDKSQAALRAKVRLGRGGRLRYLFWWDTIAVCLVVGLGTLAYFVAGQEDWQIRSTIYWLSVVFGLTALPFVPFKLPVMGNLLTPTKATGYTRRGDTVLRVIAPPPTALLYAQANEMHLRKLAKPDLLDTDLFLEGSEGSKNFNAQLSPDSSTKKKVLETAAKTVAKPPQHFHKMPSFFLSDSYEASEREWENLDVSPHSPLSYGTPRSTSEPDPFAIPNTIGAS